MSVVKAIWPPECNSIAVTLRSNRTKLKEGSQVNRVYKLTAFFTQNADTSQAQPYVCISIGKGMCRVKLRANIAYADCLFFFGLSELTYIYLFILTTDKVA